jgi:arsenate reductase-like glutaredoxin family protein
MEDPDYKLNIAGRQLSDNELLQTLHRYPDLMKKPILFNGKRGVVGYVPERLDSVVRPV